MSQLIEKFNWVKGDLDSWNLNREEKSWLLGGHGIECGIKTIDPESEAAKILEARLDTIHHIKESLDIVYGADAKSEKNWLRTPIDSLQGKSPLEFIRDSESNNALAQIVATMDGP